MQARVKWGAQPPSVGLPFDWHLPPTKWDKQAPLQQPGGLPNSPATSIPFSPSPESPYAALLPGTPHAHGLHADLEEQPRSVSLSHSSQQNIVPSTCSSLEGWLTSFAVDWPGRAPGRGACRPWSTGTCTMHCRCGSGSQTRTSTTW